MLLLHQLLILLTIGNIMLVLCVDIDTPPNVGDADLRDQSTVDESDISISEPTSTAENVPTNNNDGKQSLNDLTSLLELETASGEEQQKIEITPKARETSYEVKVTNVPKQSNVVDTEQRSGNLRKIFHIPKQVNPQKGGNKTKLRQGNTTTTNVINPEKIEEIPASSLPETQDANLDGDNDGSGYQKLDSLPPLFKDDPPIDIIVDKKLQLGAINIYPLSKLYSVYLKGINDHKKFFEISPGIFEDEVALHPYNSKAIQVLNALVDQINFNYNAVNKMNESLIKLQRDNDNLAKKVQFTFKKHKILEDLSLNSKKDLENWTKSYEFTKNKLITISGSIENVNKCIVSQSMHKCYKHFETFFDLVNLFKIFSKDTNLCNYASICQINLRREIIKLFAFEDLQLKHDTAENSIQNVGKFAKQVEKGNNIVQANANTSERATAKTYPIVKAGAAASEAENSPKTSPPKPEENYNGEKTNDLINTTTHNTIITDVVEDRLKMKPDKLKEDSSNLHFLYSFCSLAILMMTITV